jgi:hypothetical protein
LFIFCGKKIDINEVVLKRHTHNDEGISFAQTLLERYLKTRLTQLKSWTENSVSLTKEGLRRTLCIFGASFALLLWKLVITTSNLEKYFKLNFQLMFFTKPNSEGNKSMSLSSLKSIGSPFLSLLTSATMKTYVNQF